MNWDGTPELGDEGAPPATSPAILSIKGTATGLTVVTEPILPSTLVDFYVNGVAVETDQRTSVINLTDDGTNPLVVDTDYTVTTQAHNGVSPDPAPSAGVTARLDPGMTAAVVYQLLAAGFIIADTVQIGSSMTLDGVGGFTITHPDGRQTYMRADGSGNQFVGQAILDAATIMGALTILGQTNSLNGKLTLGSGVADPTTTPGVTAAGWDSIAPSSGNYGLQPRGLFDNGAAWYYVDTFGTGNVNNINKGTGARTLVAALPSGFNGLGGVVKISTNWYVLGQDNNRSNNWYCYIFNSSWVKTGEWRLRDPGPVDVPSNHSCAIGLDGSGALLVARRSSTNAFTINGYSLAGTASAAAGTYPTWTGASITGVWQAAVDTATVRYVVSSKDDGIRVFNTSTAARVTAEEWTPAASPLGLGNDASNWFTLDAAKVWKYTNLIDTWDFAFTWLDDDTGQTGYPTLAETKASTLSTAAPTKRAKWTISLPSAPPDDGTPDGANTARLYAVVTGGTLVRQASLAQGTFSQTFSTLAGSGTAPPSTNAFASRTGAIGRLISAVVDGSSNPITDVKGDGSGRVGPLKYGITGLRTETTITVSGGSHTTTGATGAWRYPTTLAETAFTAPLSGEVMVLLSAYVQAAAAGNTVLFAPEIRTGATVRSGTVVHAATTDEAFANYNVQYVRGTSIALVAGLTPGAVYNVYFGVFNNTAGSLVDGSFLRVKPMI